MKSQYMNLNITYDAPQEVWDKVILIYKKLRDGLDVMRIALLFGSVLMKRKNILMLPLNQVAFSLVD